jgi:hypothetical protein
MTSFRAASEPGQRLLTYLHELSWSPDAVALSAAAAVLQRECAKMVVEAEFAAWHDGHCSEATELMSRETATH